MVDKETAHFKENHLDETNEETEYQRSVEVTRAADTFPCGHTLCHGCTRKFLKHRKVRPKCPVCGAVFDLKTPKYNGTSISYSDEDPENHALAVVTKFDEVVQKFNGINLNLRRLREESVTTKTMGLSYINTTCDLCEEHHGTLTVVQEGSKLSVLNERPNRADPWWFFRLSQSNIVTTYNSQVQSSCICVPCTFNLLREGEGYPQLKSISDEEIEERPQTCLTEVGKIVAKNSAPIMDLQGKNVIEIDHQVRVRERGDDYDFYSTTALIDKMVRLQERDLIKYTTYQIQDTGKLYHIKEKNELEYDFNQTQV